MPITTEPAMKRRDPFDWLTGLVNRLPGARSLGAFFERHGLSRRWVWFIVIYAVSVTVFGGVALFLYALVPTK